MAPKLTLSDDAVRRIAGKIEPKRAIAPVMGEPLIRFASYQQASDELERAGFQAVGSATYRRAHEMWHLAKFGDGFGIVRVAGEPDTFEEDEVQEAPSNHPGLKMGAKDRYGIDVVVGDRVHYSLGGEAVAGTVIRASHGYLDVRLASQVDSGVPVEIVSADRRRAQVEPIEDSAEHDADASDKDNMNLHINPEKAASFLANHFGTFGADLHAQLAGRIPSTVLAALNDEAGDPDCECGKGDCEDCKGKGKTASWDSLVRYCGERNTRLAKAAIVAGMEAGSYVQAFGIPVSAALALRKDLKEIPREAAKQMLRVASIVTYADASDPAFQTMAKDYGADFSRHVVACLQSAEVEFSRTAIDQKAKDYWAAYFGDYGEQWVRDIKRRVKADLTRIALQKQGCDETAAEYWSDYLGDYGETLVDEVERSVKKKKKVKAAYQATEMTLPKPVPRRDIFAGANIVAEENWGTSRVALTLDSSVYAVLVSTGNAQKRTRHASQREAIEAYRKAVFAHCGI